MKYFLKILLAFIITTYLIIWCTNKDYSKQYVNEKYVIEDKGSYIEKYFLIRKIEPKDTLICFNDTVIMGRIDVLYTVITEQNYKYHENLWWDNLYYSKQIGDTITLEYINEKRFWRKLN